MKTEEAILELKTHRRHLNKDDVRLREAMDLAIGALCRRKPKKFKWIDGDPVCPVCGEEVWDMEWCNSCGQKILWWEENND